ncbi:MAG: integrase [Defluviimonas sp.]|nr:integrase [Defluviimonas sp.]
MAGKPRHWKEKDGRFYARLAVPSNLRKIVGRSELTEALGGDRRAAQRLHPAAVARLQHQITEAERKAVDAGDVPDESGRFVLTPAQLARRHYEARLRFDNELRNDWRYAAISIDDRLVADLRMAVAGKGSDGLLEELIGREIERFRAVGYIQCERYSDEWRQLARTLCIAELEALERAAERDDGDFSGLTSIPMLVAIVEEDRPAPVPLKPLLRDYIAVRQALGKHKNGARAWERAAESLAKHLKHSDAGQITKRNLLDWRDKLIAEGKAPKTVSDVYLASVRAVLRWAFENDRLPSNVAETVRQQVPKKIMLRERGYTTAEACAVLKVSLGYQPAFRSNPANRESPQITAAKRWIPLLCAFTGARVTEMAQLRREDVREEGGTWTLRITPEAGSVKSGNFRDVPVHRQVIDLGFIALVLSAPAGPLFHAAKKPEGYLRAARVTAGRLSQWLGKAGLVPPDIQPSHAWRHRFKTVGREIGASDRVVDAIQDHAGRTAGDKYGDVTIPAKQRVIDMLPDYDLDLPTAAVAETTTGQE